MINWNIKRGILKCKRGKKNERKLNWNISRNGIEIACEILLQKKIGTGIENDQISMLHNLLQVYSKRMKTDGRVSEYHKS